MSGEPDGGRVVVDLGVDDLAAIVSLHRRVFPASVLTTLGDEALGEYYRWQLTGPHSVVAIGVREGDRLTGLLLGGRFRGSVVGFVKGHPRLLATEVLRHPSIVFGRRGRYALRTGLRLLVRPAGATAERPERVPPASFGILVVAVDPSAVRGGVGSALLRAGEARAVQVGFERAHLTIDPSNAEAAAFYRRRGYERLGLPGDTEQAWLLGRELGPAPSRAGG